MDSSSSSNIYKLYSPYGEKPDRNLAIMACVVYSVLFAISITQSYKFKSLYMIAALVGVFLEALGFGLRILSIDDPFEVTKYSVQQSFILIAPVLIAATQYVVLGKLIEYVDPVASPLRHDVIAKIFVTCDIISFLIQVGGSILLISFKQYFQTGTNILIGGLIVQVISFTAYLSLAIVFYRRVTKKPLAETQVSNNNWRKLFFALFLSGTMVFVRSIFRVIEFGDGFSGPIATNEH
ncbi:hypothetical protein HK100_011306, partial [Physocladia obscura]